MGIFSSSKKITPEGFKRGVNRLLREKGLPDYKIDRVELLAKAHLEEAGSQRGMDHREARQFIRNLSENRSDHNFSGEEIKHIEDAFDEELK